MTARKELGRFAPIPASTPMVDPPEGKIQILPMKLPPVNMTLLLCCDPPVHVMLQRQTVSTMRCCPILSRPQMHSNAQVYAISLALNSAVTTSEAGV